MRTTLTNPTIWLLAATGVAACLGAARRRPASDVVAAVLHYACAGPVLAALAAVAALGLGSRVVLGFLTPGSYAEEVVAARTYMERGQIYSSDDRNQMSEWLSESGETAVPWADVPGVTACQANALSNRDAFYTEHAHPPTLLLAATPIVATVGPRGFFIVLLALGLASIATMWFVVGRYAGVDLGSRRGLLLLIALCAWQPVLAGVRQGDASLAAAGLIALAWHHAGRGGWLRIGLPAAVAASIALPAVGVVTGLVRHRRLSGPVVYLVLAGIALSIAGAGILEIYARTVVASASTYAEAIPNYSLAGRMLNAGGGTALIAAIGFVLLVGWWCARSIRDVFPVFAVAGLLVAPIVWSQHLALAIVAASVLIRTIADQGSSAALAAWAVLMLLLSLPDPALIALTRAVGVMAGRQIPVVPFAVIALWVWTLVASRRSPVAVHAAVTAEPLQVLS